MSRLNRQTDSKDQSTVDLQRTIERFINAVDRSDTASIASMYDLDFANVRVADVGGIVRLEREQILSIFSEKGGHHTRTKSTTLHLLEVLGDTGFVLLTRVKDLGSGWEPMFYSLVWKRYGEKWLLWREFVHQRSMPKSR
jgi:ketosteroid isomerase-like protein